VTEVDPRLARALRAQLAARRALLRDGAVGVGWKLGVGDRERIGDHIAVGYLTSATRLEPGAAYVPTDGELLHADAEVFVEIGPAGEIAGYGAALELVDLRSPPDTPDDVVATNVFHRAVAFGSSVRALQPGGVEASLVVNAEARDTGRSGEDLADRVAGAGRILEAVGERLAAGDRVITGSIVQVPVSPGDMVEADLGPLGRVGLHIAKS
jgi:hypothetical protein